MNLFKKIQIFIHFLDDKILFQLNLHPVIKKPTQIDHSSAEIEIYNFECLILSNSQGWFNINFKYFSSYLQKFVQTLHLLCKWFDFCCIIIFFRSENMIQDAFNFDFDSQIPVSKAPAISIGYYNLRGKAQVPRLLCQYLNVDYKDQLYSLAEWDRYKKSKARSWDFPDVPFLKQGDFVVTQPIPICIYLIKRFGSQDLLGKTLKDKTIVSMYVWTIDRMGNIININCQKMTPLQLANLKKSQWQENVAPRLTKYEQIAQQNNWFLGYFTIIDLSMYELIRYMELIFPGALDSFPKLKAIERKVSQIPAIKKYEESSLAIKQTDPTKLLEELKRSQLSTQSLSSKS